MIEEASAIDRFFAIKVTAKLWLQPLYGDYSPVGRLLGPFFRTWRILLGFATYLAFFSAAFLVWLAWVSLPILLIVRAVIG